jgi:glycine/D-amino acid oxidase-like deaminating enzyme
MTKKKGYALVVIGGGPIGLSTAYHASKRGLRTLVIEKFGYFNDDGSSAGASRQFRLQYQQRYMSELVIAAQDYWADLQLHATRPLIQQVGSLWFGDPALSSQEGGIQAAMATMDALSIPYRPLASAAEIQATYPFRGLPPDYSGFFQANGGIIDLKSCERALYDASLSSGWVDFHGWETVTGITSGSTIEISTDKGSYSADKLALTAGAYSNELLGHLGLAVDLDIWEMSSAYYRKTDPALQLPTWFVFQKPQDTSLFYGFPEVDWSFPGYLRVAPDIPDRILKDPKERSSVPSDRSLALNSAFVRDHMIGLDPTPHFTSTCLIALAGNSEELLLDYAPGSRSQTARIVVYTGGWAAKFIPILGEMVNQMLERSVDTFEFGKFKIDRSNFAIEWKESGP